MFNNLIINNRTCRIVRCAFLVNNVRSNNDCGIFFNVKIICIPLIRKRGNDENLFKDKILKRNV